MDLTIKVWRQANNKAKGEFKSYFPNGKVKVEANYLIGQEHGEYKVYHPNGKVKEVSNYSNGDLNGMKKFYDKNGKLMKKRLVGWLVKVLEKPKPLREAALQSLYQQWKGDNEQIDDICLIGFKV